MNVAQDRHGGDDSGRNARNEREHEREHGQRARAAPSSVSPSTPGPPLLSSPTASGVFAGDADRRAGRFGLRRRRRGSGR